jgi:hypothetical protein
MDMWQWIAQRPNITIHSSSLWSLLLLLVIGTVADISVVGSQLVAEVSRQDNFVFRFANAG